MTTLLLIRHAACDPVGRSIAGRTPGVHLNALGRKQVDTLAAEVAELPIEAVYSSPLERAMQTALTLGQRRGVPVEQSAGLNEIDFGEWTGRTLAELEPSAEWQRFNTYRSGTRIPGGETMQEVLTRTLGELHRIEACHPGGSLVAVVSHADVLRAAISHFLGMPLDLMLRLELDPASVSIAELQPYGPRLLLLNGGPGWPAALGTR
jgi:broad specificity phosphatase PhoE